MNVSERMISIRKQTLITQKQLAEGCNLTEVAIQNYESGRRKPSFDALQSIAKFFNVPADYLLGNGIFSNWEEIIERKEQVIDSLEETVPMLKELNLSKASEKQLMRILPAFIDHIEFDDDKNALIINFYA